MLAHLDNAGIDQIQIWDNRRGTLASWESDDHRLRRAAPELLEALKNCLAYIEQSEAHRGKSLNSTEIERETKRIRETVSAVETGPYGGPVARADLDKAWAAIAKAEKGSA